jgi:hypothetical protein
VSFFHPFLSVLILDCPIYIEDRLCIFVKKFLSNKFSLWRLVEDPAPAGHHRGISLAAATAAATTAFAFFITAVVEYLYFIHGFHLLSYRRLSMNLGKKRGG